MKVKQYRLAKLEYDTNTNILYYRVKQDIEIDVIEMLEMIEYVKEFVGEKRHLAIVDYGYRVNSTNEARQIYAESKYIKQYRIADAFLVYTLALRLIGKFFINVTKPKVQTKLFSDEELAKEWLMQFECVEYNK